MEVEADIENHPLNSRRVSLLSKTRGNWPECKVGMLNLCKDSLALD